MATTPPFSSDLLKTINRMSKFTTAGMSTSDQTTAHADRSNERSILHRGSERRPIKDLPRAELHRIDTGHFALVNSSEFIAERIREFQDNADFEKEHGMSNVTPNNPFRTIR
jgi:hypothetical protein